MNAVRAEITTLIPFPVKGRLSDRQVDNRVEKILALKEQEKALKEAREAIEAELKACLGDTEYLETKKYRVNWPKFTRTAFDSKAFKADHKRLYAKYTREKEQRQLTFSAI